MKAKYAFAILAALAFARSVHAQPLAQDVVTVGTVSAAPGSMIDVPVYVRDVTGTPLGIDQPASFRIQAYSLKVNYAPAAAIQSVTFTRGGITTALTPTFEVSPSAAGTITLIDTFAEGTNLIPFVSNAPAPGNQVATLHFTLAASATPGSAIALTFDPVLTQLTNEPGTVQETTANGSLALVNGAINVLAAPSITKAFGGATIALDGSTSLTITISNPNAGAALSGVAFSDPLPAGLMVALPSGLSSTCGGNTTAIAGPPSTLSLTGGTIAANGSCTITVNVVGTSTGTKVNTTGNVSAAGGLTGNTATASILVVAPPSIAKAFGAATVALNGSTSLTVTIGNPNTGTALNGVAFTDPLPSGLSFASPSGLSSTCGGAASAVAGSPSTLSLTGGTVAGNSSCTVTVNVVGTVAGPQVNNTSAVTASGGLTGNSATASIVVVAPPSIAKTFGAATVELNGSTSLTVTISNPNTGTALSGIAFSDPLPAGLSFASPSGLSSTCGGTANAIAGSPSTLSLAGGTIAANASCTVTVNVVGTAAGPQVNNTGNVTAAGGLTGNAATASVVVVAPPSIAKAFGAASVALNGSTSLTVTITNPNTGTVLNGVAFTDPLPAGLSFASPSGLSSTCGGAAGAIAGSPATLSVIGGTIAANASCAVTVNIVGTNAGTQVNNTGNVTAAGGLTGNSATASIVVVAPPVISKAFGATSVLLNGSTTLSFTIANPMANAVALTGIGFNDNIAPLIVATPNGLAGDCGGGVITAVGGSSQVSLTGASLAPGASCTFSIVVTGVTPGVTVVNSVQVTSTNGGAGNTATATLNVGPRMIPTLEVWALVLLSLMLAWLSRTATGLRKRR